MKIEVEIAISPQHIEDEEYILAKAIQKAKWKDQKPRDWRIIRKSIDARKRNIVYRLRIALSTELFEESKAIQLTNPSLSAKRIIIIGAGPAGYFAALRCLEHGLRPIILERGKDVRQRRRDLRAIQQDGIVDPDSNYCFGEGGAGTYSDGKLYTRSHKRGKIQDILRLLVDHGAKANILYDAHPHIGSNKLPNIIGSLRETIQAYGGEVHFGHKVIDFIMKESRCHGVVVQKNDQANEEFLGDAMILATGHSARDIFKLCEAHEIDMESKPFAMGVRVEHPQALIDEIQYKQKNRNSHLPPATYRVACQVEQRGVFSFCMCPGGLIVPSSTAPAELVVNGMSLSKRDSPFANSGVVAEVSIPFLQSNGYDGVFAGVNFQQDYERRFFEKGDGTQQAPSQRLTDFVNGVESKSTNSSSYIPGVYPARVDQLLPDQISTMIRRAIKQFDTNLKGYYTSEAQVIGLESRTSSPVRINRDVKTRMSSNTQAFFPCGEGAGYAGGILSAAMDGRNVADAVHDYLR